MLKQVRCMLNTPEDMELDGVRLQEAGGDEKSSSVSVVKLSAQCRSSKSTSRCLKYDEYSFILIMASLLAMNMLTSCQTKQESGAAIGGATGALIGSQFGGSIGGRLLGAGIGGVVGSLFGSAIGKQLDDKDKAKMDTTTHTALEKNKTGQAVAWKNPDSGNSGVVTPTRTYKSLEGKYCREYTHTITVNGQQEKGYGTACRQPDGSWQIVS